MQTEIKRAERELAKEAEKRRAEYAASKEGALEAIGLFRRELIRLNQATLDSVRTVVEWVDEKGNMRRSVTFGTVNNASQPGAVVKTNGRSRRERANRIRQALGEVEKIEQKIRDTNKAPADLGKTIEKLRASIPDRNEYELIGKPN